MLSVALEEGVLEESVGSGSHLGLEVEAELHELDEVLVPLDVAKRQVCVVHFLAPEFGLVRSHLLLQLRNLGRHPTLDSESTRIQMRRRAMPLHNAPLVRHPNRKTDDRLQYNYT